MCSACNGLAPPRRVPVGALLCQARARQRGHPAGHVSRAGPQMLLLDTDDVPRSDRVEAFRAAFSQASVPAWVEHLEPAARVRARMHLWQFGGGNLFSADSSGFRLVRTARHVRMEAPAILALAFQSRGVGRFAQFGSQRLVRSADLMISDLTAPYSFSWTGTGGSRAFQVPHDVLGLPVDVIRAAAPRLPASPLHPVVLAHLRRLARSADELAADAGAPALGTATTQLVRALLVSVAGDRRWSGPVHADPLLTRVLAYARLHLADPGLGAESLARVHHVSVRHLYAVCAEAELSIEQWIIHERLEAARTALVSPAGLH